jgi:ADP-heptose:LPS heptosyltransferase
MNLKKAMMRLLVPLVYGSAFRRIPKGVARAVRNPRRILLINGLHIGDAVVATSVIPVLRNAYPCAEIGFVVGSWARMVIENHPDISYVHSVDHWMPNRQGISFLAKLRRYLKSRRVALKEIEELGYDVSISLSPQFPDFLDLCWTAKIPVRIGFSRSIFASLASDLVDAPEDPFTHQGARMAETLRAMPIDPASLALRHSTLPPSSPSALLEVSSLFSVSNLNDVQYRIIHMGSGSQLREMPLEFWRGLAGRLSPNCKLLFTGRGSRERENIATVVRGLPNCTSACDRLSWEGFVAAVRNAEVLYGVESMAGHVASAVGTRCVVVYGGTAGVARWRPEGSRSTVFTNHVPCAPCSLPEGCKEMTCMRMVSPDDLVQIDR